MSHLKRVYIAHEYGGKKENLIKIRVIIRDIILNQPDVIPVCPWYVLVESLDDSDEFERALGLRATTALLKKGIIDEFWIYGSKLSLGVELEINHAVNEFIPLVLKTDKISMDDLKQSFINQGLPSEPIFKTVA